MDVSTDVYPEKSAPQAALEPDKSGWLAGKLRNPRVALRLSLAFLAALYVRTIGYGFVYDDLGIVFIQWKGWKALGSLFLQDLFASTQGAGSSYYRPLASAWGVVFMHWTGGTPGWFHLESVAIHLVVFYLAYVFGRYLFHSEWIALLTAFFFCLHPTKVEAVAWIGSSGCDGLGAIFFFASLICYFKWDESQGKAWLGASVVLYAACLFTKETLAVLPGLIAIHFWLTTDASARFRRTFFLLLPYGIALAGYFVMRHVALMPHVAASGIARPYLKPSFTETNIWSAPLACWWYLKHLLLPTGLSVMYDSLIVTKPTPWNFVVPAIALLVTIAVGAWLWYRYRSLETTFTATFFVLTMAPYIVLAPMAQEHDRYLYLASYPFAALMAWLLLKPSRVSVAVRYSVGGLLILLWALSSWHETGFWADNLSLWQRASVIAPSEIRPKWVLADEYVLAGDKAAAARTIDEGLQLHPDSPYLLHSRAAILEMNGDLPAAKAEFEKEFAEDKIGNLKPIAAMRIGEVAMKQQNYPEAEKWYRTAVSLAPSSPGYHVALAKALRAQGREADAREQDKLEGEVSAALRKEANSL
jgi:tetratricopeptide (TPR) repeat protein